MLTLDIIEKEISNVIEHGNNRGDIEFLANLYICRAEMQGREVYPVTSIETDGVSEFAQLINGRRFADILPIFEELVEAVQATNPRLYNSFISRL